MRKLFLPVLLMFMMATSVVSQEFFEFTSNTGQQAVIAILEDAPTLQGDPLPPDAEVGVFTPAGLCVGAIVWEGDGNQAITAWGNNIMTQEVDGIRSGEPFVFKMYSPNTGNVYEAKELLYKEDTNLLTTGIYEPNGMYVIESVTFSSPDTLGRLFTVTPFVEPPEQVVLDMPEHNAVVGDLYESNGDFVADIDLVWYSAERAEWYELEVVELAPGTQVYSETLSDTSFIATELEAGVTYRWSVRGCHSLGCGEWSGK